MKLLIKDAGHVAVGEEIQSKRALLLFICTGDEEKTLTLYFCHTACSACLI